MGAERGQDDPWDDELVAEVTAQRRALLPLSEWEQRVAWRDRALIAQEQGRRLLDSDAADHQTGGPVSPTSANNIAGRGESTPLRSTRRA